MRLASSWNVVRAFAVAAFLTSATPVEADARSFASYAQDPRTLLVLHDDCARVVADVRRSADGGDLTSMRLMAQMLERGCGVVEDERRAGGWYKRILAIRPTDAMAAGYLTLHGDGRSKDAHRAVDDFRDAVRQGDPFAAKELAGALWYTGDPALAGESHRASLAGARGGDVRSSVGVAFDLSIGYGTSMDQPTALRMLRAADSKDDGFAALQLGLIYRDGAGVPEDPRRAESYFRRAVRLGYTYAGLYLAVFYLQTHDAKDARADSVRLIEEAQSRLYYRANIQAGLAEVYILNVGVPPDFARAIPLLKDGIAGGQTDSMDDLAYLKFNGFGLPVDFVGGIKLWRQAAALGDPYARTQLAAIHIDPAQDVPIPDTAMADFYNRRTAQQLSQPPNQMPDQNSPAFQTINGGGEGE